MSLNKRKLTLITLSHIVNDSYPAFIPMVIPILMERGYSVSLAGSLGMILTFSTNFPQPLFGLLYDKTKKYLIFLAPLFSAIFIGTAALMPSYFLIALFLVIGGLGVSLFHPEATHIARSAERGNSNLALSIFLAGGTGGYALGGLVAGILIWLFGIKGLLFTLIFGILASYALYKNRSFLVETEKEVSSPSVALELKEVNRIPEFLLIFAIVTIIVSVHSTVGMFLPSYLKQKGLNMAFGAFSFILFVLPGSLGGIAAGSLAKKFSIKKLILVSQLLAVGFLYAFVYTPYPYFLIFIPLAGGALLFSFPLLVNQSYLYLPKNKGVAGGSIIGLAWGLASVLILITGALSDLGGSIAFAYKIIFFLPLLACLLLLKLKI